MECWIAHVVRVLSRVRTPAGRYTRDGASFRVGLTTDGPSTDFPIPTPKSFTVRLAVGSYAAVWFAEIRGSKIGRITVDGDVREYAVPDVAPVGIMSGPAGALWFTEMDSNKIGRLELPA